MGVRGWDEIQDGVALFGFSDTTASPDTNDHDWNINAPSSTLRVVSEVDYGRSHNFAIVPDGATGSALEADIESGTIRDQQGFYNEVAELTPGYTVRPFVKSRGFDPRKGVLNPMTKSGVKSVRAMFGVAELEA